MRKKDDDDGDINSFMGKKVDLKIDVAYTIGKSISVLLEGTVIGHLVRHAAKPVWNHLKFNCKIEANIYDKLDNGFNNSICYSSLSKSPEIGIQIHFFFVDSLDGHLHVSGNSDASLFLTYVLKHRLNCFPGVTRSNCPSSLE